MTLKHYRDSLWMKLCNMIIEYVLIIAGYFLSGYLRMFIPRQLGREFAYTDVLAFWQYALTGALVSVIIFFILGDYETIHYRRMYVESFWILVVQLINGFTISALLYWQKGGQFSRMWLALYVAVSCILIFAKRAFFHYGSDILFKKYLPEDKILILGSGGMLQRFIRAVNENRQCRYNLLGYMAVKPGEDIAISYLGTPDTLYEFLQSEVRPERLVVCDEALEKSVLKEILYIASVYDIKVFVIPVFNDYLIGEVRHNYREDMPGIHLFPVSAAYTDDILGVNIAVTNMDKTLEDIEDNLDKWRGEYICVSNVHTTVMAHDDANYRQIQNGAVMALPDGGPLSVHSRNAGNIAAARVTGPDLMKELLILSEKKGYTHFFYGASEKTLELLRKRITENYPGARIAGMISPPFRAVTPEEDAAYIKAINEARPDFIWVGLGAPKQEIWMAAHRGKVTGLMIGVGAAFDYESGNIKRAPLWMQRASLEWLYRLLQDPKRLFKRYLVTNAKYLWLTRK